MTKLRYSLISSARSCETIAAVTTSREQAIDRAREYCRDADGLDVDAASVQELADGWFVGWRWESGPDGLPSTPIGCNGVIINKKSREVFALGSAFPIERDLDLYDRGFHSHIYDLVILGVSNLERTLDSLERIGPTVVKREYEGGTVWRIPRKLTRKELSDRLQALPSVFADLALYSRLEELIHAEDEGWYEFRAIGRAAGSR